MAINFFSGKKEFRSLSNFWEYDVIIDGRVYKSGEHAFHGEKFFRLGSQHIDSQRSALLLDYSKKFLECDTPALAKKLGGKKGLRLTDDELALWSSLSIDVQKQISQFKFDTYPQVKDDLVKSAGKILVHPALRCAHPEKCFWEGKFVDGAVVGANHLGNIWMHLRDKF
jgi:ribA/ribD-fused uncharacterized protein